MRLIQVVVPGAHRDEVLDFLVDEDIDHIFTEESMAEDTRDDGVLVQFPLPTQAVDFVLDELREIGLSEDDYTVIVTAESANTEHFAQLEERFVDGGEEDDSIAHEEMRAKARDMNPNAQTYYSMTLLSAIVATAGLLLDSPAIVVGSMVIAPQVGSSLTTSVGAVLNDDDMVIDGLRSQAFGLGLVVLGATAFGWLLKSAQFVPSMLDLTTVNQISQRISPGLLSITVGVCAGAAGAFGLATALPVSLVGVMIAAALIPAAAAVGIGLAWGLPLVALGAFVLLVVNAAAINFSAAVVLWYLGYRPDGWDGVGPAADVSLGQFRTVLLSLVVLAAAFAGAGLLMSQHIAYENTVNSEVESVLQQDDYADLELVAVRTQFNDVGLLTDRQEITVVVSRQSNDAYPDLAETIGRRVASATGTEVVVDVEFVERQEYTP